MRDTKSRKTKSAPIGASAFIKNCVCAITSDRYHVSHHSHGARASPRD